MAPIQKRNVKYLIIGGGAAGFSAIQAIKENDPESQVKKCFCELSERLLLCVCLDCFSQQGAFNSLFKASAFKGTLVY